MAQFRINKENGSVWTKGTIAAKYSDAPTEMQDKILRAQGELYEAEERKNAGSMLNVKGYGRGVTQEAIELTSPYERDGVRMIQIRFKGNRPGRKKATRTAEVAFFNEFGVGVKMPKRNFIAKAIAAKQDEADRSAADIFAEWVDSQLEI